MKANLLLPKLFSILMLLFSNSTLLAQWPALSVPNVQVTSSAATGGDLKDYWACSDGVGGSYSIFTDDRQNPGGNESVYCQRIDRWGNIKFLANGLPIATIAGADQDRPKVTDDGFNNAIASWQDSRSGGDDIYAQKIDSNGIVQWVVNGVLICNAAGNQDKVWMVSDGFGGAIIAWEDARSGTEDIYAQRINSAGVVQWTVNGIVICNAIGKQKDIHMVEDGLGGAIIVWIDERTGVDIYAQRVNSNGVVQWAVNGVVICNATNDQKAPKIATDGANGGIISWSDKRGVSEDIYSQRISPSGIVQWSLNGVLVCNAAGLQRRTAIASDSYGGAVITWEDKRAGTEDIYAQRIDANGITHWLANGNIVSGAVDVQKRPDIAEANGGKTIVIWEDNRSGTEDIYLQVIDTGGIMLGTPDGIAVCTAVDVQKEPFVFKSGATDWISIWQDDRNQAITGNADLYAQGLNPTIVSALPIELLSFTANVNENKVDISWVTASEVNNDYFTIEKSKDAKTWVQVSVVNGIGNSNQSMEYFDVDYNPYRDISYYRLKQTDFDGNYTYSNIVPVKFNGYGIDFNMFPSPANKGETLYIDFEEFAQNEVLIVMRDIQGKEYYSKLFVSKQHETLVGLPIKNNIPSGVYLIIASSNDQLHSKKLIIK